MAVQTTYDLAPAVAVAGLLADSRYADIDGGLVAGEDIPFGRVVEFNTADGKLYLPKATTLGKAIGIALYPVTGEPYTGTAGATNAYGWKAGSRVQVLRKGRVWAEANGSAPANTNMYATANVVHASTDGSGNAQHRGKVTVAATSAGVGTEVSTLPAGFSLVPPPSAAPTGLALVSVNLG